MARKTSPTLTDAELRVMDIVWAQGSSTVQAVVDALPEDAPLAYSTVLTTMRILERKGYLTHKKEGRAFVYQASVAREEAQSGALKHIMKRFFDDSPELLLLNLMESKSLDATDLDRLRAMINDAPEDES